MAPVTIMGHKVYGVFIGRAWASRQDDRRAPQSDDQAEGSVWVISRHHHYNSRLLLRTTATPRVTGRDDGNGTMETTYYGNATRCIAGPDPGHGSWTDQEKQPGGLR